MRRQPQVAQEAKTMTRAEVVRKALEGRISWVQAGVILGVTSRHLYRLRLRYEQFGVPGMRDGRTGRRMPQRIAPEVVEELCLLRRERYEDFSVRHFHERLVEKHGLKLSYTSTKELLQTRGMAERAPARGKYRRRRERRPMVGMLLHLDASTHEWIAGLPSRDLVVMLDDADGRILHGQFVEQEGTVSTLMALEHVLRRHGRFGELYTDRGSHFCPTAAGRETAPTANAQVSRVLKALGIRHILARSPEARGRSERAFGTIQGRLPQELRLEGIRDYESANRYLDEVFVADFNRRFSVAPAQAESAFVPTKGWDLRLLMTVQHERVVARDNTVAYERLALQLPRTADRLHFMRCPVTVHEFLDGSLGVSFQGRLLARYSRTGETTSLVPVRKRA